MNPHERPSQFALSTPLNKNVHRFTVEPEGEKLPHNIEAEQNVLGAFFAYGNDAHHLAALLDEDDFYEPLHAKIFRGMQMQLRQAGEITLLSTVDFVSDEPPIGEMTMRQYMGRLVASILPGALTTSPQLLKELSARRRMCRISEQLASIARADKEADITAVGMRAMEEINTAVAGAQKRRQTLASFGAIAREVITAIERTDYNPPTNTGYTDLDATLGGLRRGELTILAGRPSMGKSALAIALMTSIAKTGKPIHFFSKEMPRSTVVARALSQICFQELEGTRIEFTRLLKPEMYGGAKGFERQFLWETQKIWDTLPIDIDDQGALTVLDIAARARRAALMHEAHGRRLALLVIDHLGIIKATNRYSGNKVHETAEKTNALCALAKELDVSVLCLAQLNRGVEGRDDKKPILSDLRDAGNIEEDADNVLMCFRESYYLERQSHADKLKEAERLARLDEVRNRFELMIMKNRNGPCLTVNLFCDMSINWFGNAEGLPPQKLNEVNFE